MDSLKVGSHYRLTNGIVVKCIGSLEQEMGPQKLKFVLTNSPTEDGGFFVRQDGSHVTSAEHSVKEEIKGSYTYDIQVGDEVVYGNGISGVIVFKDEEQKVGQILRGMVKQEDGQMVPVLLPLPFKQELFKISKE